jgi:hypothetical protein
MKRYIPAFPTQELNSDIATHPMSDGMTLRDYFAGQVLMGFMQQHALRFIPQDDANYCYRVADAMMEAREKE